MAKISLNLLSCEFQEISHQQEARRMVVISNNFFRGISLIVPLLFDSALEIQCGSMKLGRYRFEKFLDRFHFIHNFRMIVHLER